MSGDGVRTQTRTNPPQADGQGVTHALPRVARARISIVAVTQAQNSQVQLALIDYFYSGRLELAEVGIAGSADL